MPDRNNAVTRFRLWLRTFATSRTVRCKQDRVHFIRPRLETLEDRTLPSASAMNPFPIDSLASAPAAPPVAAIVSFVDSMMELRGQWIATLEQNVIGAYQAFGQEIAQALDSVQQQWDHLLGINPNSQTPSLPPSAAQSGSDWGSGSGSGSSSTATPTGPAPASGVIKAQPMDSNGAQGDRYEWDPGVGYDVIYGSGGGGGSGSATHIYTPNSLASNPGNWLKNEQMQTIHVWLGETTTIPGNKAGDTVILGSNYAGSAGQQPIEWDQSFTFSTLNLTGYTAQETLDSGANLELTGANNTGTSLSMDDSSILDYQYFNDGQTVKVDKDATITNMTLAGSPNGVLEIAGGTTSIAGTPGAGNPAYSERTGVQIVIDKGATLSDGGNNPLQFTNSGLAINVYGTMVVGYGTGTGLTLMDNNGYQNNYINVSGGTLTYLGAGGVTDTFTVPVSVTSGGTFRVTVSAIAQNAGGTLIVKNLSGYAFPNGSKNSVYMTGASSSVQLAYGDTLQCDNGYYQASGTLETTDTTKCTLKDGSGTTTIAGGSLIINQPNNGGYGELDVTTTTLQFAGLLIVAIQVYNPNTGQPQQDFLHVSGTTNLQPGCTLTVYVNNPPPANGSKWIIIKDDGGNITGDFAKPITTNPQTNLNAAVDQNNKTQYVLSF